MSNKILESILKQKEMNNKMVVSKTIKPKMQPETDIKKEINKLIDNKAPVKDVREFYKEYIKIIEDEYSDD